MSHNNNIYNKKKSGEKHFQLTYLRIAIYVKHVKVLNWTTVTKAENRGKNAITSLLSTLFRYNLF